MNGAVRKKGLTIIELMTIVAILGVLVSFALPAYHDYRVRDKVRDAVSLASPARTALGFACSKGTLSGADNEALGLSPPDAYDGDSARSIAATGKSPTEGVVTIVFNAIEDGIDDGQRIVYAGACDAGRMRWTVSGDVPQKYMPEI